MTTLRVRRRSPVVEAVQWHKPGDEPEAFQRDQLFMGLLRERLQAGYWITWTDGRVLRVLTPEQFEAEYERVE